MSKELFDTTSDGTTLYEEIEEFYNRHYITIRPDGAITSAWSDGPHPEKDTAAAICINEQGGYQFRFYPNGEENPPIYSEDGIPLYRWDGQQAMPRTEREIAADRAAIPAPPPSDQEQLRAEVATLQADTAPVMAAARAYALTTVNIPDTQALEMATLFPTWEDVLSDGSQIDAGRVINDGGLYRVMQSVTPQAHQAPGDSGMLAVYRPIEQEHAGTPDDPIPWVYGIDCYAGLYYSYNGAVYRVADGGDMIPCVWAPDTPGLWQWETV